MGKDRHLYKIGEFASKAGVTVRTLRYYEELGLVSASEISAGGIRFYTDGDLGRLHLIIQFKDLGFSLEDIQSLLTSMDFGETRVARIETSRALFNKQLEQIESKLVQLQKLRASIVEAMETLNTCQSCRQTTCPANCPNQKVLL